MTRPLDVPVRGSLDADVDDDVIATGVAHSEAALVWLRREILRRAAPVLVGAGIPPDQADCHLEPKATRLGVSFHLPVSVGAPVKRALAVRVLDAVRAAGRTYGPFEVTVRSPSTARPEPGSRGDAAHG